MSYDERSFAIKVDGLIDIKTVSPTAKGAKVNFLCVRGLVLSQAQDHLIDPIFEGIANRFGAVCVEVVVKEKGQ